MRNSKTRQLKFGEKTAILVSILAFLSSFSSIVIKLANEQVSTSEMFITAMLLTALVVFFFNLTYMSLAKRKSKTK